MKARNPYNSFLKIIYVSSVFLALAACTTTNLRPPVEQRESTLRSTDSTQFQAKVVLKQKGAVYHFTLHWQQKGNQFSAQGSDFLGRELFQITGNQHTALFRQKQQTLEQSSKEIIAQQIGLETDPQTLLHLLQAIAVDRFTISLNKEGLPLQQQSQSLMVEYTKYSRFQKVAMPSIVRIQAPDISLKLAIYSWSFN